MSNCQAKNGKGRLKVTGDLTLHGVTRPVIIEVEELSREGKDPMGDLRRGASATTKLSRKDFGIGWNKVLETGGVVVGDEIAISIDIEIIKAKYLRRSSPGRERQAEPFTVGPEGDSGTEHRACRASPELTQKR